METSWRQDGDDRNQMEIMNLSVIMMSPAALRLASPVERVEPGTFFVHPPPVRLFTVRVLSMPFMSPARQA